MTNNVDGRVDVAVYWSGWYHAQAGSMDSMLVMFSKGTVMSNPSVPFERIRVALILLKQSQRESRATCPSIKVLPGRYNTGLRLGSHYDDCEVCHDVRCRCGGNPPQHYAVHEGKATVGGTKMAFYVTTSTPAVTNEMQTGRSR
jgi:hypothetical protein